MYLVIILFVIPSATYAGKTGNNESINIEETSFQLLSLQAMPLDVRWITYEKMDVPSLHKLMLTSKFFRDDILESGVSCKWYYIDGNTDIKTLPRRVKRAVFKNVTLKVLDQWLISPRFSDLESIQILSEKIPTGILIDRLKAYRSLRVLDLSSSVVSEEDFIRITKNHPNLEKLYLGDTRILTQEVGLDHLKFLSQLKYLDLGRSALFLPGLKSVFGLAPNLIHFGFINRQFTLDREAFKLLQSQQKLRSLKIATSSLSWRRLARFRRMTELKKLNLIGGNFLSARAEQGLLSNVPGQIIENHHHENIKENLRHIESIEFSFDFISSVDLQNLIQSLPQLHSLSLEMANECKPAVVEAIKKSRNIKSLTLVDPMALSFYLLEEIVKTREKGTLLQISGSAFNILNEFNLEDLQKRYPDVKIDYSKLH